MRTHRGSLLVTLTVLLLASAPGGARGQSPQAGPVGTASRPSQPAGPTALGAAASRMPMAAAPSTLGLGQPMGQPMPTPQMQPTPYLPMGYGYADMGYAGYGYAPTMPGYGGVYPAMYTGDGNGAPQPLPVGDAGPMDGGGAMAYGDYGMPDGGCEYCYGEGCAHCLGLASFLASGLSWLLPYSEAGCCAPRWYDIAVDYVYIRRDNVCSRADFTSEGINGDIVLSTENLDFDWRSGLRLTGAVQALVGGSLEFTYFGLLNWSSSANVSNSNADLYSVISDFGTDPLGGFDETDRSKYQSIAYSSSIDSFELHFRKRWVGPNCRLQGSWLAGVRYLYLLEDFEYYTVGGDEVLLDGTVQSRGWMDYDVRAKNSLTGFQLGGDLWTCVVPGINFGGELKAGVYGNYSQQGTHIVATTTDPVSTGVLDETDCGGVASFVGEGTIAMVYRTSPNWSIRGAYNFLYLDQVALAPENFNSSVPFSNVRTAPGVDNKGNTFYHGFTAGLEWMW